MSSLRSRSSVLLSVKKLQDIMRNTQKNHRILDASWYLPNAGKNAEAEFMERHIPGAQFFDIDGCAAKSVYPHMIPRPEQFADYVGKLGISNNTHVIVYDNSQQFPLFSAQRVWWSFRLFGHENVSILEGGLQKWLSEGGETSSEISSVDFEKFHVKFNPDLVKTYEDIKNNLENADFMLLDARPEGRFKGTDPEPRDDVKPGCIPNSVNIPFMALMNLEDGTLKSTEEMKAIFDAAGVDFNKPLVASCGTGISAGIVALSAYICGKKDTAIYDGSWTEWYLRAPDHLKKSVPAV